VFCAEQSVYWYDGAEPAHCTDAGHDHRRIETHVHRTPVLLPDGSSVVAVSFDPVTPYERDDPPDFGVYLDPRWDPPWPHEHVDWPDFGVPADVDALLEALRRAAGRAQRGERVEIGCLGGHGRTGTALACLAILAGVPPAGAVAWVRTTYCVQAVETDEQRALVAGLVI
jgi:hypothetical protein